MSPLLGHNRDVTSATSNLVDGFVVLFAHIIERVRFDTAGLPGPSIATNHQQCKVVVDVLQIVFARRGT